MSQAFDECNIGMRERHAVSELLEDGGVGTGQSDLWATYAGIRTLKWINRLPDDGRCEGLSISLLARQNDDGGFAWQRGLPSDVWATFYATQTLSDLNHEIPKREKLVDWIARLQTSEGGFAMLPGQNADVWATYYCCRIYNEILQDTCFEEPKLARWLNSIQSDDGGISWAPGFNKSDVRAAYYAVHALDVIGVEQSTWNWRKFNKWLCSMQDTGGGFRFQPTSEPCLWATFRATKTFQLLGRKIPDIEACAYWINSRLAKDGFRRWENYSDSDVWANFSAVGALHAIGLPIGEKERDTVAKFIGSTFSNDGLTYRSPGRASDALSTSSLLIRTNNEKSSARDHIGKLCEWLKQAHMKYEDGVMYMPGRGAEIRCTLWAYIALDGCNHSNLDYRRLFLWLHEMQNPDGGFGYWLGRGSDLTATTTALSIIEICGGKPSEVIDSEKCTRFIVDHKTLDKVAQVPQGEKSVNAAALCAISLYILEHQELGREILPFIQEGILMGGYRDSQKSFPNLYTTYLASYAFQKFDVVVDDRPLARFLNKLVVKDGLIIWTPFGNGKGDPMASTLHRVLSDKIHHPNKMLSPLFL